MKFSFVQTEMEAGRAGDALNVAVSSLNSINDLVSGDGALLESAPEDVKGKAKDIVNSLREFVSMLNKEVGKNSVKKKVEEKPEDFG